MPLNSQGMIPFSSYKNSEIERMLNASNSEAENDIWDTLDAKIRNLQWKERHLRAAKWFAENIRASGKLPHFPRKDTVDDIDRYLEVLPVDPKSVTSDYETGAEMLLSAHDYDRAAIIEQSSSTEYRKRREEILLAIRTLRIRHIPANSAQVFSLIDVLYEEQFESQGLDLDVFHEYGNQIIVQRDFTRSIDDKYDLGFSAYLAEAVFIYCFICSLQRDDQQGEKAYE